MEEEVKELEENLREKESKQELFAKKVFLIGELHTRRALLANRLGRIKSESMMRYDDIEHEARKEALALEEEMAGISKTISDFRPTGMGDLKDFQTKIHKTFDAVEAKIVNAESKMD